MSARTSKRQKRVDKMSARTSKRQKRIDKILDHLRTYDGFTTNYGGCVRSIDLFVHINKEIPVEGSVLMQDIIRAYNQYEGGRLDDMYRDVCKDADKRGVYQRYLRTDWKRAIESYYSCNLSIPGLTKKDALTAMTDFYDAIK